MPFIKFTVTKITASGTNLTLHFVNVNQIATATYEQSQKLLELKITGDNTTHAISGDEAVAAAKTLAEH